MSRFGLFYMRIKTKLLPLLILPLLLGMVAPFVFSQQALARGEEYVFNQASGGSNLRIYAKNSTFFKPPQTLTSDAKQTNHVPDEYKSKISSGNNGFVFTVGYNCSAGGKRETGNKDTINSEFWFIRTNLFVNDAGHNLADTLKKDSIKAIPYVVTITHFEAVKGSTRAGPKEQQDFSGLNGDQIRNSKVPSECLPDYDTRGGEVTTVKTVSNLTKQTDAQKATWSDVQGDSTTAAGDEEVDTCDATGAPLSWIVCPIIDMGVGFTKFAFNDFIAPFMEDVPISTDPTDPGYNAWKQFRLLGNILLVGTMLAIVYAQVKGDR